MSYVKYYYHKFVLTYTIFWMKNTFYLNMVWFGYVSENATAGHVILSMSDSDSVNHFTCNAGTSNENCHSQD